MDRIEIHFTGKPDADGNIRVPRIKHSHIRSIDKGTRSKLLLADLSDDRVTRARLTRWYGAAWPTVINVRHPVSGWQIIHKGTSKSGFMVDAVLALDLQF